MAIRSLRNKMIALIALPTLVIYVVILGVTWTYLGYQMNRQTELEMEHLADIYADKFDKILKQATYIADMAANTAGIIENRGSIVRHGVVCLPHADSARGQTELQESAGGSSIFRFGLRLGGKAGKNNKRYRK